MLPITLTRFLMSTHYTHYDLTYFTINCLAVLGVVIPKLPWVRAPLSTSRAITRLHTAHHRLIACA
jgi:hypothetical protein